MIDLREIANGWLNVIVPDESVEALAKDRLDTCNGCEFKISMIGVDCCGLCHCPLIAKTRSPDSECPKGKWLK